jgi:Tol biopolymer transport system component
MEENEMKKSWKKVIIVACLFISLILVRISQAAQNLPPPPLYTYLPAVFKNFDPRVAPLAFIASDPSYFDQTYIYGIYENGSGFNNLTINQSPYLYFTWSPNGSKIAFNAYWNNVDHVYTMNADGTDMILLTSGSSTDEFPSWSSDGTQIAFQSWRSGFPQIYVMDSDGSDLLQLTYVSIGGTFPRWAPVGNKIAFDNFGDTQNDEEIYVVNSDGTGLLNLTNNSYYDSLQGWSPNGSKLLFLSNRDQNGQSTTIDLYVMDSNGANPVRLTTNGYAEAAAWSPDGSKIIYSQYAGPMGLFIINPDGSGVTELQCQSAPIDSFDFSWSPDASKIAFTPHSSTTETQGVYIAWVNNSACSRISTLLASSPKWRPVP